MQFTATGVMITRYVSTVTNHHMNSIGGDLKIPCIFITSRSVHKASGILSKIGEVKNANLYFNYRSQKWKNGKSGRLFFFMS